MSETAPRPSAKSRRRQRRKATAPAPAPSHATMCVAREVGPEAMPQTAHQRGQDPEGRARAPLTQRRGGAPARDRAQGRGARPEHLKPHGPIPVTASRAARRQGRLPPTACPSSKPTPKATNPSREGATTARAPPQIDRAPRTAAAKAGRSPKPLSSETGERPLRGTSGEKPALQVRTRPGGARSSRGQSRGDLTQLPGARLVAQERTRKTGEGLQGPTPPPRPTTVWRPGVEGPEGSGNDGDTRSRGTGGSRGAVASRVRARRSPVRVLVTAASGASTAKASHTRTRSSGPRGTQTSERPRQRAGPHRLQRGSGGLLGTAGA